MTISSWIQSAFAPEQRKTTIILLAAPVLMTTFKYYGSHTFFSTRLLPEFSGVNPPGQAAEIYLFCSSAFWLGLIPWLIIRGIFHERLADYGVRMGDFRFGLKAFALLAPIFVIATWPSARMPEFMAEYPFWKQAGQNAGSFLVHAGSYLLFYLGWEFFFRGFLQFGLRPRLGDVNAVLVQTLASCLLHMGKPAPEIYGSILAGLVWGWLVFRTGSLLFVVLLHWLLGVSLDLFLCFPPAVK
jgi:uncharacterized protein